MVRALRDASLSLPSVTVTAVVGSWGVGQGTLVHVPAGLDRLTDGRVSIGATELSKLSATRLAELRRVRIGFVSSSSGAIAIHPNMRGDHARDAESGRWCLHAR